LRMGADRKLSSHKRACVASNAGTLNIHPSLLPQFRGAAPVQRALEAGVAETGVSVAYTVLACDAGPVLAAERMSPEDDIQHPQLLTELFRRGTELLLKELPGALDGSAVQRAVPQDESGVTHADKVSAEEALLDFSQPALTLHNKVRSCPPGLVTAGSPTRFVGLGLRRRLLLRAQSPVCFTSGWCGCRYHRR